MTIQSTSREAYSYIKPTLSGRRLDVYRVIHEYSPICIEDVSIKMGVYPNKISGRFAELERMGMIINTFKRKVTGHTSHILWRAATEEERARYLEAKDRGQKELF